jgi:hypothetical protein
MTSNTELAIARLEHTARPNGGKGKCGHLGECEDRSHCPCSHVKCQISSRQLCFQNPRQDVRILGVPMVNCHVYMRIDNPDADCDHFAGLVVGHQQVNKRIVYDR